MHGDDDCVPSIYGSRNMAAHGVQIARVRTVARGVKPEDGDRVATSRDHRRRERVRASNEHASAPEIRQRDEEPVVAGVPRVVVRHVADDCCTVGETSDRGRGCRWLAKGEAVECLLAALARGEPVADRALDIDENDVRTLEEGLEWSEEGVRSVAELKIRAQPSRGHLRPERIEVGA